MGISAPQFSLSDGKAARRVGMSLAENPKKNLIEKTRRYLQALAGEHENRCAPADDAARFLVSIGESERALGNAAGPVFRPEGWEATGCWTKVKEPPTTHVWFGFGV
jgi:hypothetical protein